MLSTWLVLFLMSLPIFTLGQSRDTTASASPAAQDSVLLLLDRQEIRPGYKIRMYYTEWVMIEAHGLAPNSILEVRVECGLFCSQTKKFRVNREGVVDAEYRPPRTEDDHVEAYLRFTDARGQRQERPFWMDISE